MTIHRIIGTGCRDRRSSGITAAVIGYRRCTPACKRIIATTALVTATGNRSNSCAMHHVRDILRHTAAAQHDIIHAYIVRSRSNIGISHAALGGNRFQCRLGALRNRYRTRIQCAARRRIRPVQSIIDRCTRCGTTDRNALRSRVTTACYVKRRRLHFL